MKNLKTNGYIIQKASKSNYRGIDGDNWYLNYCSDDTYFANFHVVNIDNSFENPRAVECCTDVAYSGGSYYSCVLNDVVSGRIPEFQNIRLNENGLFSSYEEAEAFLKRREELEKAATEYIFEKGNYVIYMLTEVEL